MFKNYIIVGSPQLTNRDVARRRKNILYISLLFPNPSICDHGISYMVSSINLSDLKYVCYNVRLKI